MVPIRAVVDNVWHIEAVDSLGDVGGGTSLALDLEGLPCIAYIDWGNRDLKYACYNGNSWLVETVDSASDVGAYSSLALDSADHPHIAYSEGSSGDLKYAYHDGSIWHIETVGVGMGGGLALALDLAGHPHITSYGDGGDHFYYSSFDGTHWVREIIESGNNVGAGSSLALDTAGHPHVSYVDSPLGLGHLMYAHRTEEGWQIETLGPTDRGEGTSLALDTAGYPHISYQSAHPMMGGNLMYAYQDSQGWHVHTLESGGVLSPTGGYSFLALDEEGHAHISYNRWNSDLGYAHDDGSSWLLETVDGTGYVGYYTALALDATGRPHISYYNLSLGDLKYAYQMCAALQELTISGPASLSLGHLGHYSATYHPQDATLPVTVTWGTGEVGASTVFSVTSPGTYSLRVTATNACSQVTGTLPVTVTCLPVTEVAIIGPGALLVRQDGIYQAVVQPPTASLPLTWTWSSGATVSTTIYSWTVVGTHTISMTATNICGGEQANSRTVRVWPAWPWHLYLPLIPEGRD